MTGGRGSHRGGNTGGSMPRVTALAPAVARLPTGRTFPALLALPIRRAGGTRSGANVTRTPAEGLLRIVRVPVRGSKPTAGHAARFSTIFRLPRPQQQMPVFRVLTR
jgi:hypothetical protein